MTMTIPGARPAVSGTRPAVPGTQDRISSAQDRVSGTQDRVSRAPSAGGLTGAQKATAAVIVLAALALASIGLYLSFEHVAAFAHERLAFRTLTKAQLFTAGVDTGIMVLIAVDLLMAWLRRPIGWVRYPVWLLTAATVLLNAFSAAPHGRAWQPMDYLAAGAHAVVPVLFITVVEVGRTAIDRVVRPTEEAAGVPLHRWLLAPLPSWRMYRRMRLYGIDSYAQAVAQERQLTVYKTMLERKYGSVRRAPSEARLPLTMAPYGLSVDQALMLPQEAAEAEQLRAERAAERAQAAELRAAQRAAEAEIARAANRGRIEAARHASEAETGVSETRARASVMEAEAVAEATLRAATAAARAEESADTAEAEHRAAEAERAASEARARALETERRALEAERAASETRRRTAEMEAAAAEAEARQEAARRAAEEARLGASEARARALEIEQRALEMEDAARLSPRERAVRKVARMALAETGGDAEQLPLERITAALKVSSSTASQYRNEAYDLLASGYRPQA
jgi:hypothetical protein